MMAINQSFGDAHTVNRVAKKKNCFIHHLNGMTTGMLRRSRCSPLMCQHNRETEKEAPLMACAVNER